MAPFAETPILSMYGDSPMEVTKEPDLLNGWWTSEHLYSLERRAVFSKTWICIAHRSRFTKPGDYISLELAGFPILIILGKDGIARAFHNVCRHRAYTITKKPAGSSLVLGCRYHGWSYDTRGNLLKAPQFDGIQGFNKSENGLFKIRTCIDRGGFIHINLDAGHLELAPDCEDLVGFSDNQGINVSSKWLTGWEISGGFNWKTIGASDRTGIGTPGAVGGKSSFMEFLASLFRPARMNLSRNSELHVSPTAIIVVFPNPTLWAMLTTLPVAAGQCNVKCDIFSTAPNKSLSDADIEALKLHFALYVHGLEQHYVELKESVPTQEPPSLTLLKGHLKLERLVGREILPGRKEGGQSASFCKAEKVCKELDAIAKASGAWSHASNTVRVETVQGELEW